MSFSAGEVYVSLGGRFSPAGFSAFTAATTKAGADMKRAEKEIIDSHSAIGRASAALGKAAKVGAVGGILAIGAAAAKSVSLAASFEQQLSQLGSVSGATGKQMAVLKEQALDAGKATKYSAQDAALAQTELAKGGVKLADMGGALNGALGLAAAGGISLENAATTTATALNLFAMRGDQATHVADAFATAANATTADVGFFAEGLSQGGAAAKAAGLNFDDTTTALEALAANGFKSGSDAGTSLKTMLTQLAAPTKQQAELTKQLGLDFFDAHGNFKSLADVSTMLRDKLGGLSREQRLAAASNLVGQDGMRGLLALYDQGPAKLRAYEDGLKKQGTAAKVAAENQDNLKGKLENLKGSVETLGIQLGTKAIPFLTRAAEAATKFVNGMQDGTGAGGDMANLVGDIAHDGQAAISTLTGIAHALNFDDVGSLESVAAGIVAFKTAATVVPGVMQLGSAIGTLLLNARTAPTIGAFASELPLLANPVGAAAVAVGGLAAAFVYLSTRESEEEQIARRAAAAKREQAHAIRALHDSETGAVTARTAAQRSTLDLERAEQQLSHVRNEVKTGALKGRDAELAVKDARLGVTEATERSTKAHHDYESSLRNLGSQQRTTAKSGNAGLDAASDRLARVRKAIKNIGHLGGKPDQTLLRELAAAQDEYSEALRRSGDAAKVASISNLNLRREAAGMAPVTAKNADGFRFLIAQLKGVPTKVQTRYILDGDQAALARAGRLAAQLQELGRGTEVKTVLKGADSAAGAAAGFRALLAGVPTKQVVSIIATTKGKAEVDALNAATAKVHDRTVTVDANADAARAALQRIAGTKIEAKTLRILGASGDAQSKVRALIALGIPAKTARVLAAVSSALSGVNSVQAALNALRDRSVTVTETHRINQITNIETHRGRATGRGAAGSERALVGEGRGPEAIVDADRMTMRVVTRPQLADLGPHDYVIPYEDRYRGRALGLMQSLAKDMGLAGYSGGRPAKHKKPPPFKVDKKAAKAEAAKMPVPAAVKYAAVDEQALTGQRDGELKAYKQRMRSIKAERKKVDAATAAVEKAKTESAKRKANKTHAKVAHQLDVLEHGGEGLTSAQDIYVRYLAADRNVKRLHSVNVEIGRLNTVQETDRQKMSNAAAAQNPDAYKAAQKDRNSVLTALQALYKKADAVPGLGPVMKANIESALATIVSEQQNAAASYDSTQSEPVETDGEKATREAYDRFDQSGMTDEERFHLGELERDKKLAGLTPGLDDDTAAASSLLTFVSGILDDARDGSRFGHDIAPDVVGQLADTVHGARDDLDSLTGKGTSTNSDQDVQAQIAQANRQRDEALAEARVNADFARTAQGAGDIQGGPTQVFHINTLHPGDPRTVSAIGDAAVAGMGYQGTRPAKASKVGL